MIKPAQNTITNQDSARTHVFDLIKDIKFCMMVTQGADGHLFARPMAAQKTDDYSKMWFFTAANSPKVQEISQNAVVLLSYADPDDNNYVSISGEASIVKDRAKIDELWSEPMKAWFPKGKDDPNIALICVNPMSAEYWDQPSNAFVQAFGYLKAKITGEPEKMGDNKTVRL